ncbi:hypothetical protein DL991_10560 [Amycolatopsis sp. WAC 01375]|uniref:hypothetical protein n=1 Tax=Amycolatopsis sp. WAC 01375 TaxID=2203194 RepID=UPI000F7B594E|nr:hypothetical protein [Amycolatopsis sp. WAC 01375]RSM80617.1 hypothetical protein DL991_10560 [Amycolatopsis sp. WAC 01375]
MEAPSWVKAAGNPAADKWVTVSGARTVLVVVPHMTAGTRLVDLLPLLESDHRVQVHFTVPDSADEWPGVRDYVRGLGGVVVPWSQVLRSRYDLVLASSYAEVDKINGQVMVVSHGVGGGRSKYHPWAKDAQMRDKLMRDGRVVPAAVACSHDDDARRLGEACPEAAGRAVVTGDPCYDRMCASVSFRDKYRNALGVEDGRTLVVLSSTWSQYSLFGAEPDLFARVLWELPASRYRVVAALHPNIWSVHGSWQVRAWLADLRKGGLGLLPPEDGWRAALVAADVVIGDHGSVTQYAAAMDVPVLMNAASEPDVPPGSIPDLLRSLSDTLLLDRRLEPQIENALHGHTPDPYALIREKITSCPGEAGARFRSVMYRLLGLPEPARGLPVSPVPLPILEESQFSRLGKP